MSYPAPYAPSSPREHATVERALAAASIAAVHAARHDRDGTFPTEGLAALADSGYLSLVASGAHVPEVVLGNLALAKGDASLGLVVAMHHALLGRVRDSRLWPDALFERVSSGGLINSLATEPEMGSPSRGGLPTSTAARMADGWRLNGRKTFSSGSTVLEWGLISAAARTSPDAEPYLSNFLVPMQSAGVSIEPSWDTLGMRATCSHTVVLSDVLVPLDAEVPRPKPGGDALPHERAWSMGVSAVYLGVAEAARDFAIEFARTRTPSALGKPIATLPHIRERVGRMDLLLYQARAALLGAARAWDAAPSPEFESAFAIAKYTASNNAIAIAEEAMRLVGGSSLDRNYPLERHYRDVRGGLHHPPQDDATLSMLARHALGF